MCDIWIKILGKSANELWIKWHILLPQEWVEGEVVRLWDQNSLIVCNFPPKENDRMMTKLLNHELVVW